MPFFGLRRRVAARLEPLRGRLQRLAWSWCGSREQAEDLVQETFARAIEHAADLRDLGRLDVWVTRMLSNLYLDRVRRPRREIDETDVYALADDAPGPEREVERQQAGHEIERALRQLKPETRQIITLVDIAGFSYSESARILDIPVGTVMSRLSRGRQRLLDEIERARAGGRKVVALRRKR